MRSWCFLALLSAAGCAGAPARPDAPPPSESAQDLRAELRRERRTVHTLENEVALLRARLRDTFPPPPAPEAPAMEAPASAPGDPLPETLGAASLGEEEVEVVYEGEAAAESTVRRPRIELVEDTRSYGGREPEVAVAPLPQPSSDRLPVLSGEVPTVASQLRRARAAAPPPTRRPPSDPRGEYQRYLEAARAGNHEYAAQGLRSFLDQHPRHELADNAQYWLAETYYGRKRYALAQVEFEKVVERYPRGNKLPDALLKIGYCRAMAGKRAEAIAVLRRLVRTHPSSGPAGLARAKLEELDP